MSAGQGSVFPRIAPDDPLAEAARATNEIAEQWGLEQTLAWLGITAPAEQLAYLGEQRALRAIAAAGIGMNMGAGTALDEQVARAIVQTPLWRDMRLLLVSLFMDGVTIGWKGREIAVRDAKPGYPRVCPECKGTGGGQYNDCPACDGNGVV